MNLLCYLLALVFTSLLPVSVTRADESQCAAPFNTLKRRLNSDEQIDLCQLTQGKTVLLVNTASRCGFSGQFTDLEALHQEFAPQGLVIIGFPSNTFFQAAENEAEAAEICYRNHGVSFTMLTETDVRGPDVDPIWQLLADQGTPPKWNFYKYLLDHHGQLIDYWSSHVAPTSTSIRNTIIQQLQNASADDASSTTRVTH
ncbi:MAG: glutathione peroxidase [Ferrimonas sp.]